MSEYHSKNNGSNSLEESGVRFKSCYCPSNQAKKRKRRNHMKELFEKLLVMFSLVQDGTLDKATVGEATMYRVKDIVRIDIKLK